MNDPYHVLERQLDDAVQRRAAGAATSRGRRRRRGWNRRVLPAIAVIVLLGTGAATAAVVLGPDDQPTNQVKQALFAGHRAADASPACQSAEPRAVHLVDDPVPGGMLAQLGVLRRQATVRDRIPPAELATLGGGEVLASSIRVARAGDGWSYRLYLSRGFAGTPVVDPVRCAQARRDASIAAAAQFSADVRAEVRERVDRETADIAEVSSGQALSLELDELRPDGRKVSGGGTIVRNNTIPAIASSMGRFRGRFVSVGGLVSDGVVTVRVVDESGSPRERSVTVPVNDNVYHALMSRDMGPRMTVEWRDSDDRVIRRTDIQY